MKYFSFLLVMLLVAGRPAIGQNHPQPRKLIYKISITDSKFQNVKGYLFHLSDSSLKMAYWPVAFASDNRTNQAYTEIPYRQISEITIKRNHGAGRGALKGALLGLLIGAAAGFIEGGDPKDYWFRVTAGEKAIIYGGLAATAGTGIGALIGALAKKRFMIAGKRERFDEMKFHVLTKTYGTTTISQ